MRYQALAGAALLACAPAHAQVFTGFPPAQPPFNGNEVVPSDTGRSSVAIGLNQLAAFGSTVEPGQNWIIAGDAAQNLWQRGLTGGSVTAAASFAGPDRWFYWSGTGTAMTVSQSASIRTGFAASYRVQRTAGQTGVIPVCVGQEISTGNSTTLQGQVVEVDLGELPGADFSATAITLYLVTGTGVNEGAAKLAYTVNGGGGASAGWTGSVMMAGASYAVAPGLYGNPAVVAKLPTNETEVGVALCWTPTGTAGANDYLDVAGVQLRQAPGMFSFVSVTTAYSGQLIQTPAFSWRLAAIEAQLQYQYHWHLAEGVGPDAVGMCRSVGSGPDKGADCVVPFPFTMVQVPRMSYGTGFSIETSTSGGSLSPCAGLTTAAVIPGIVPSVRSVMIDCQNASPATSGSAVFLFENGGNGVITADAEWL